MPILNTSRLIAAIDRAANTLEQLEPVLNHSFDAKGQVEILREGALALAVCPRLPDEPPSGASGCDGRKLDDRWRAVPAKPTKAMLMAAREQLVAAGHAVTFETVKALYLCFLDSAPAMPVAATDVVAPEARLAPFSG